MAWYIVQQREGFDDKQISHTLFNIQRCVDVWKTNHVIADELERKGFLSCSLIRCEENEMLALTNEDGPLRRRRAKSMGPFDCISISDEEFDQFIYLLHVTANYQVIRCIPPKDNTYPVKILEVKRGLLRGLKGKVICDRANLRKFTPTRSIPDLDLLILIPAPELKPLTKVEYENLKLRQDTSARWYMILCKNVRTLQQAFKLPVRERTQEGIFTESVGLEEFTSDMRFPQGISKRRYYYHIGKPFPSHYFFVFTTLADVHSCRIRNPYARIGLVWNNRYEPIGLKQKEFKQLVYGVEGKQFELSSAMKRFIDGLKTGDKVGFFLNNLQEFPIQGKVERRKKTKFIVVDEEGRRYTLPETSVVPPRK